MMYYIMVDFVVKDNLNLMKRNDLDDIIDLESEKLLWTGRLTKINKDEEHQEKDFVVSTKNVINASSKGNIIKNFFISKIRRIIDITKIEEITYSSISGNCIIHVPTEYDYYLYSPKINDFILAILFAKKAFSNPYIKFYKVEEIDLYEYCMFENKEMIDLKKHEVEPIEITYETFDKLKDDYQMEVRTTEIITETKPNENKVSFDFKKIIGKGFFGSVYLAEKRENGEEFAIKTISKLDIIKRDFSDNLKTEIEILHRLKHPFIVTIKHTFEFPLYICLAMPFVSGGDLWNHIRHRKRFSESEVKFFACQILDALCYLHNEFVIYRDLKPENVLLDYEGNIKLADFGISKVIGQEELAQSYVGAHEYLSPEVILKKKNNKNVDIWSFGIILFEMAIGLPPFFHKDKSIMLKWILKAKVKFPSSITISDELKSLIKNVFSVVFEKKRRSSDWSLRYI